jgi:hypothetical protein
MANLRAIWRSVAYFDPSVGFMPIYVVVYSSLGIVGFLKALDLNKRR